jgi:hypothetical protein
MSVGRQRVRRLGLLLTAGMVVQVPALVGVEVSRANANAPQPTYSVALSINSNCVADVTATWNNTSVKGITFIVRDLSDTSASSTSPMQSVSGRSGTQNDSMTLQLTPLSTQFTNHWFHAIADFYDAHNNVLKQAYSNPVDAPCHFGTLGVVWGVV